MKTSTVPPVETNARQIKTETVRNVDEAKTEVVDG